VAFGSSFSRIAPEYADMNVIIFGENPSITPQKSPEIKGDGVYQRQVGILGEG
jgi:hypothetical protein